MTLRLRLSLAFIAVVLLPLLVAGTYVSIVFPRALDKQVSNRLATARNGLSLALDAYCERARSAAQVLGQASAGSAGPDAVKELVARKLADYAQVISPPGTPPSRAGVLPAQIAGTPESPPNLGDCGARTGGTPFAVAASVRLESPDHAFLGTATAAVVLSQDAVQALSKAVGTNVTVVDGTRPVVTTLSPPHAADTARVAGAAAGSPQRVNGRLVSATAPQAGRPTLAVQSEPLPSTRGVVPLLFVFFLGALVLAAGCSRLLARLATRPLAELSDAAARVAGGDLDTQIPVRSRDEVGRLGTAFNGMTDELRTYIRALESSRDELRLNLTRLGDTLSSTHDLARILTVILETAMASVRAEAGAVLLVASARGEVYLKVGRGLEGRGGATDLRLPLGEGISGLVAASGDPIRGRVGSADGELTPSPAEPRAHSLISIPLKSSGRVVGVLNLYDRIDADEFDDGDLATIRTFASQATVAVDNVLLHQEAQRLSITDGLTSLWNYRYFTMNFGKEIERAARFGRPLALLMLDIDRFKLVNDEHGHQRGDSVLIELAMRVKAEIREVDTLARYGGEELVLVLPETDLEGAEMAAERIVEVIRHRPFGHVGEQLLPVTVSIGVAVFPQHGTTANTLLRRADEALYVAKDSGRDCWRVATGDPTVPATPEPAAGAAPQVNGGAHPDTLADLPPLPEPALPPPGSRQPAVDGWQVGPASQGQAPEDSPEQSGTGPRAVGAAEAEAGRH
ncbi:MAG: diguanylate cyclase [Actinomycetota bacterium]|nr:diguanylate cyclase [Actinomycetota bacterium]